MSFEFARLVAGRAGWLSPPRIAHQRRQRGEQPAIPTLHDGNNVHLCPRVKLSSKRGVDLARNSEYHGSGVNQVIRRLEQQAKDDPPLQTRLQRLKAGPS